MSIKVYDIPCNCGSIEWNTVNVKNICRNCEMEMSDELIIELLSLAFKRHKESEAHIWGSTS